MTKLSGGMLILMSTIVLSQVTNVGYSHIPASCLKNPVLTRSAYLNIPYKDGKLDEKHAKLYGITATFDPKCGSIGIGEP